MGAFWVIVMGVGMGGSGVAESVVTSQKTFACGCKLDITWAGGIRLQKTSVARSLVQNTSVSDARLG